jgi:hypothetical protein
LFIGATPSERKLAQPHETRAHGLKTVAPLTKYGFLTPDGDGGFMIDDRVLQALQTCDVRY